MTERQIVIPGETITTQEGLLPGEGTEKRGDAIVAVRYGLSDESNNLVKVIPISGVYSPRRGNIVIGTVEGLTANGWLVDVGYADNAFLSLMEVPRFVDKNAMEEVFKIGDLMIAKIWSIGRRGIDLSLKSRGLGRITEGMIIKVNPNKVPRIIGKEGSMVNLIKENTGCNLTIGQNGLIWIKGDSVDQELYTKKAINFVAEKSIVSGLTEEVEKWFKENKQ